jgi:hypothetical protein
MAYSEKVGELEAAARALERAGFTAIGARTAANIQRKVEDYRQRPEGALIE